MKGRRRSLLYHLVDFLQKCSFSAEIASEEQKEKVMVVPSS